MKGFGRAQRGRGGKSGRPRLHQGGGDQHLFPAEPQRLKASRKGRIGERLRRIEGGCTEQKGLTIGMVHAPHRTETNEAEKKKTTKSPPQKRSKYQDDCAAMGAEICRKNQKGVKVVTQKSIGTRISPSKTEKRSGRKGDRQN